MRVLSLVIAAGALLSGGAQASEPTPAPDAAKKALVVCSEEERDWRAVSRDLGMPDFVTAKEVREGKAWTGAKCITPAEMRKLTTLASAKPAR